MRFLTSAKRAAGNAKRKGKRPFRLLPELSLRAKILTAAAGIVVLLVAAGAMMVNSGLAAREMAALSTQAIETTRDAGFEVRSVRVEGRLRTDREEILEALGVQRGDAILQFDPELARLRLEALPWVQSATVERALPQTIRVEVHERHPIAIWRHEGRTMLVDSEGGLIPVEKIGAFINKLPLMYGEGAYRHAPALLEMVTSEPRFAARVTGAMMFAERRWNVQLDNKVEVRLPEFGASRAWERLARLDREYGVLNRDIVSVDLRQPDRLVVKVGPEAREKMRERDESLLMRKGDARSTSTHPRRT